MVCISGMKMPECCRDCQLARLVPYHNYRDDSKPKILYKCFLTKQVGTEDEGDRSRLSECPLREERGNFL